MSKKRKTELVGLEHWPVVPVAAIDWTLCILCQEKTSQPLVTPTAPGYVSLAENLSSFQKHGALPATV